MGADTQGNFTIRGDQGIHVTVGTNEIIISGIAMYYDNTDGNIVIDNDLLTINLADDLAVTGNVSMGGDLGVTGDAVIAGDLTVNGTYYTVHAEHVYTQDDYIILREGATTPLAAGSYAGFQVTKYDGTNDGRLVVDNAGVARVGDVGDEQPLLTRDEAANLTDEDCLVWDAANSKAVTQAIPTAISTALAGKNPTIGIQTQTGTSSLTASEQNIGNLTITKKGMYLIHIVGTDTLTNGPAWSVVGVTKGGNVLTKLQNLYYQGGGTYYHSVIGLERFNAGEVLGIYRQCSIAMTDVWALSATYLGDY